MRGRGRLITASLAKLRPTQMALGYQEVKHKREEWTRLSPSDARRFLRRHRFPAVRGPGKNYYLVDNHHMARALQEENIKTVRLGVLADLSQLSKDEFWKVMLMRQWAHPYDKDGELRDFSAISKKLKQLPDDPYRSLAATVKGTGHFHPDSIPFAEFLWADFFRSRISRTTLRDKPEAAVRLAKKLARSREAVYLARGVESSS